ncbi:MAG: redoxin domain-containing protein [Sphingobacteriaceae bacterium]|jgi:peroxiredoxin
MALTIGQAAPAFKLFNSEKEEVSLSSFLGKKVIIHFFPQAFTGVCTTQLCTMRDNLNYYTDLNAVVLGISVDSVFTLEKFKAEQNYNFSLLSDFNKEVSKAYDALYENWILNMNGVAKRAAFVIDSNGLVQYAEVLESAGDLPNFEAIKACVAHIA